MTFNVPMGKVKMVMGDTDLCPYDAGTWGSLTIRRSALPCGLRQQRQGVLLDLASAQLRSSLQLEVKDGIVYDQQSPGKKVSGQLAKGRKLEKYLDVKPSPEDYKLFSVIGKPLKRTDSKT